MSTNAGIIFLFYFIFDSTISNRANHFFKIQIQIIKLNSIIVEKINLAHLNRDH